MPAVTNASKVIIIDPTIKFGSKEAVSTTRKQKVAAYARVSTEQDAQQQSYNAQVDYYTTLIQGNEEWEFAGVYADEGITGTNTKNREGFKRMIKDAKDGKIDIILTKSISRFARNTVDALTTIRELKTLGIEVRFEKENLRTLDPSCEVMLTILSSLAQEESRSISTNVQWSKRKCMMDGKVEMPYSAFLGYKKGADGRPEIVEEEAKIVRRIFQRYIEGAKIAAIAKELKADGIKSPRGSDNWASSTVRSILGNEKYKGDALLQKTITVDYLSKKRKKNEGELAQYYVKESHPAIIEPDLFDYVQYELERREKEKNRAYNKSALTARIVCGECKGYYGHKTCHSNKTTYDFWGCNFRQKKRTNCSGPNARQRDIYSAFKEAVIKAKDSMAEYLRSPQEEEENKKKLEEALSRAETALGKAQDKLAGAAQRAGKAADTALTGPTEAEKLQEQVKIREEAVKLTRKSLAEDNARRIRQRIFLEAVQSMGESPEYSDSLFARTVARVVVQDVDSESYQLNFYFLSGQEITIPRSKACR